MSINDNTSQMAGLNPDKQKSSIVIYSIFIYIIEKPKRQ